MKNSLLLSLFVGLIPICTAKEKLWIGTFTRGESDGIYRAEFDPSDGSLSDPRLERKAADPSFLAVHPTKPCLYAIGRSFITAFTYDAEGTLRPLNQLPATGKGPVHLAVSPDGGFLAVASILKGKTVTYRLLPEGNIAGVRTVMTHQGSGSVKVKQDEPQALGVHFSGDYLFVPDMGCDKIFAYRLNGGLIRPADVSAFAAQAGDGPRHLAVHPDGKHLFAVHMLSNTLELLQQDGPKLTSLSRLSTLPQDFQGENTASEVAIHPEGKWVLVSNRGHDSIAVYRFDSGKAELRLQEIVSCAVKSPRHFTFDPSAKWVLAGGEKSDDIKVFSFDPVSGSLKPTEHGAKVASPACLLFQPPPPVAVK